MTDEVEGVAGAAGLVAAALRRAGWGNAFAAPPAAWLCPDPVTCAEGAWERTSLAGDGCERGVRRVRVTACCEDPTDARVGAAGVAVDLRRAELAGLSYGAGADGRAARVVAVDVGAPAPAGRDGSGRWLWALDVRLTCAVGP